jgi:hypothetical protein
VQAITRPVVSRIVSIDQVSMEERRRQLRELDDLLDGLERLRLHDQTQIPEPLARKLQAVGIPDPQSMPLGRLISQVLWMEQRVRSYVALQRRRDAWADR